MRNIGNQVFGLAVNSFVVAMLFMQSGCTSTQVLMGLKVHLDTIQIASISVRQSDGAGIAPGHKSPLVVTVTQGNGEVLQTEGAGKGKVLWSDLTLHADVVTVDRNGIVSLPDDPRSSDGLTGHVSVTVPNHPDLRADVDIPLKYDAKFAVDFSGRAGSDGMNGSSGLDGSMGSQGSFDPSNPSAGGNGGDGSSGSNGGDGDRGGDAPALQVQVACRCTQHALLQVEVSAGDQHKFFLIDPIGGSLNISANGGAGGSGGRGGRGGRGGAGGSGTPNGSSGRDGLDGRTGFDGSQGRGGCITVTYDPDAAAYLSTLHLSNRNGPRPTYTQAPVAPLW